MSTIAKFAAASGILGVLAFSAPFLGSIAYADSGNNQSWNQNHSSQNGNSHNNHSNQNNWNHQNGNNWSGSNWYSWHQVNGIWQQYFNWTAYCTWFAATYGYTTPSCAPYLPVTTMTPASTL